jgi:DNA modification methylase
MILAGHGRVAAAKLLGLHRVPTIQIANLSEAHKRALVLAENKLVERAGWNRELLAVELRELCVVLPDLGLSIDLTGFEVAEVDAILTDVEEYRAAAPDDDAVPPPEQAVSLLSDLWELGPHRLLCGDARNSDALRRLLGGDRVDMVFTDPPYNVAIDGHVRGRGRHRHAEFAMASGEMSVQAFSSFLTEVLGNAAPMCRDGALLYVCMDWRHVAQLMVAGQAAGVELKNLIVWVKSNAGQGSLYRSAHELIALFKVGEGRHVNNVELGRFGRNRSNVWHYAGVNSFKAGREEELAVHPTVKPVALVADAIKDVTGRRAIVLDLFGGSGTTLIAAERTGRRARLMEIDPRYVDVTITRYQRVTGRDAVHAKTGKTFAELAAERCGAKR